MIYLLLLPMTASHVLYAIYKFAWKNLAIHPMHTNYYRKTVVPSCGWMMFVRIEIRFMLQFYFQEISESPVKRKPLVHPDTASDP